MSDENEGSRQALDADRRQYRIGKNVTEVVEVKLDHVRKLTFRSKALREMERTLNKKSIQIIAAINEADWSHEDTLNLIWAGLITETPDIALDDLDLIWDATPMMDRVKAFADVVHAVSRAVGLPVDEERFKKAMELWNKQQNAIKNV
jgi:hypothetical protein